MNVLVEVQFGAPSQRAWEVMRALANGLTDRPHSVRVSATTDVPLAEEVAPWLLAIAGQQVTIRGIVIDGIVNIGTVLI